MPGAARGDLPQVTADGHRGTRKLTGRACTAERPNEPGTHVAAKAFGRFATPLEHSNSQEYAAGPGTRFTVAIPAHRISSPFSR